ncbi:tRNA (adenosine(37)-N6)-dimethylallyltransferase MiaA [Sulfitobacter sp. D35]|uniref:tRNA (adenosine(37)-N6)-dimethylallyltransferase MiaA n=1 Tax=Sulfitobacter sp. D35 TaxID=3083252 RepID=UPI00296FE1BA|nr:tRNA (adenosine(37)-N6)-dimethylallyltransferase MiaA [Sulfitobacter sp. D35]MDW4497728.1 tRNA (adenosine(37)-N6)-dimethylallyltransferase MiaA [Sulfitobacter sp. D35]
MADPEQSLVARHFANLPDDRPVLIAGPTASGKSALALALAESRGGVIVNADASQVYDCWRVLTARPSPDEEARAPHRLFGHVADTCAYSTGHWLREVTPLLRDGPRPIIVGGTGLYFSALTEGLAEIPPTPPEVRSEGDALALGELLSGLDARTAGRIDRANRARVQRAWEVLRATGRPLADWQDETPAPVLPRDSAACVVLDAPKGWLDPRIARRFDAMLSGGALEEAEALRPRYDPVLPAHRAIGAPELIDHLEGRLDLDGARAAVIVATRQFAKRQRTWFRKRMRAWTRIPMSA